MTSLRPVPNVLATPAYAPVRHGAPCDIDLAGSESSLPGVTTTDRRYPDATELTAALAARLDVTSDRVLVTAGADDALDRTCRVMLAPGRAAILTAPTFEMLPRYVALAGAACHPVAWPGGELPVEEIISAVTHDTTLIAIVSPNNPTGAVATIEAVRRIHDAVPNALLLLDLVYVDFANSDITAAALQLPRVVVVRSFSKARGLPGARVGYAIGPAPVIAWLRAAGSPYPVSAASLATALQSLAERDAEVLASVTAIRSMRDRLFALLDSLRLKPIPSQANFVCLATPDAAWLRDALAGFGVAARLLPAPDVDRLRITCPANDAAFARVEMALRAALTPQVILFDLDGVLADVSRSYRFAIQQTAAQFGVRVTDDDIRARKAIGNANDDWALTAEFIAAAGVEASLEDVTARFEQLYQGDELRPGLRTAESLTTATSWLAALALRYPLAIVTGRPRADAERFLATMGVSEYFSAVIAREAGPLKPDPFPVRAAMAVMKATRAWMIGDTPDDIASARSAGALPIGIVAPGDTFSNAAPALFAAGAARVIRTLEELIPCLP